MSVDDPLDIINAATAEIGEDALESLDDDLPGGYSARAIYQDVVGFNLEYPFTFCREVRQLSQDGQVTPLTGYAAAFMLPPDRLGPPLSVTDDVTDPRRRFSAYVLAGNHVHTDANPVFAWIRFTPPVSQWSPGLRSATVIACASRLALALASDEELSEFLWTRAYGTRTENFRGGVYGAAIRSDSFSTPPRAPDWTANPLEAAWRS